MSTDVITPLDAAITHYLKEHARIAKNLAGHNISWLNEIRQQALQQFAHRGFPTFHDEDWKYTSVNPITKRSFCWNANITQTPTIEDLKPLLPAHIPQHRLVFINGKFSAELSQIQSRPQNAQITNLAQLLQQSDPLTVNQTHSSEGYFTVLNTAFIHDGAYIHIPRDTTIEIPIHLIFLATTCEQQNFSSIRNLITLEENSQATIIESYISNSASDHFINSLTELKLNSAAVCEHYKLLQGNSAIFHIDNLQVHQQKMSQLKTYSFALGGAFVRSDINTILDEHTECHLSGLYIVRGKQHVDHHTLIEHAKPNSTSHENYKGVLMERAHAVFNGRVIVHPGAQKTIADQANKNLLLSNDAEIDTKPQLEIYNDDVRCTHGATVGQLDEDSLFYLQSRGLDFNAARGLLIYGFIREIIDQVPLKALREQLESYLKDSIGNNVSKE